MPPIIPQRFMKQPANVQQLPRPILQTHPPPLLREIPWEPKLIWMKRMVEVVDSIYQVKRMVQASVCGKMLVHKSFKNETWSVRLAAIPDTCLVNKLSLEDDAKRIAEFCWFRFPEAFKLTKVEEAKLKLPDWFEGWVKACQLSSKWVNPEPFEKGQ